MQRLMESTLQECLWRRPSILLLDDLDALCKAPSGPEEELGPEALYSSKIAEGLAWSLNICIMGTVYINK